MPLLTRHAGQADRSPTVWFVRELATGSLTGRVTFAEETRCWEKMSSQSELPLVIRAQRVLLWMVAVISWSNAIANLVGAGGGFYGLGYALLYLLLGVVCAVVAIRLPRAERWVRGVVIAVYTLVLLGEVGRFSDGDMRALIGVILPAAGLVLIVRRPAREFFGRDR